MPIFKRDNIIDVSSSVEAFRVTQRGDGNALLIEDATNPDSTPFIVKNNGRVGIGTTDPSFNLQVGDYDESGFKLGIVGTGSSFTEINFSRSGSAGTSEIDSYRGVIGYSHLSESLYLSQNGSRALTISGSQNVGIGTTNPSEKLHVAGGNIRIDDGYGIYFGSTQGASSGSYGGSRLNEYEQGTWTPEFTSSGNSTWSYNYNSGSYTRIGNTIFIEVFIKALSVTNSNNNFIYIKNLPFTVSNENGIQQTYAISTDKFAQNSNYNNLLAVTYGKQFGDYIFISRNVTGSYAFLTVSEVNTGSLSFSGFYRAKV